MVTTRSAASLPSAARRFLLSVSAAAHDVLVGAIDGAGYGDACGVARDVMPL